MTSLTILGGGPAGLAVALYAQRSNIEFTLFERSDELGGLCRTLRCGEHLYDSGAHRFHDRDPEITREVRSLLGGDLLSIDAPSKIWDSGRFVDFPPTPLNFLFSAGLSGAGRIGFELLAARWRRRPFVTFADFAVSQFGETLARRFVLGYSEKVWGLPADQLSPEAATSRLHGMTFVSLLLELMFPARKTPHIDGKFLYPRNGYGQICRKIVDSLPAQALNTGCEVVGLECEKSAIRRIHFAARAPLDPRGRVLSTLPLTQLVRLLGHALPAPAREAAGRLRFRHIRLIFFRLARPRVSPNASIYIADPRICISRLCEPKNRSSAMAPAEETAMVAEVPCFADDPICRLSPEDLASRVEGELAEAGLIRASEIIEWKHHFLSNAYPVYSLDYAPLVRAIRDATARIANLDTLGRGGLFLYSHLHDQIRLGKDYVTALTSEAFRQQAKIDGDARPEPS